MRKVAQKKERWRQGSNLESINNSIKCEEKVSTCVIKFPIKIGLLF